MDAIIFIGLQASGKSTFYRERFFDKHVRISLDQLRTRYREQRILTACLETQQRFVVENTNPRIADRKKYIDVARKANYRVVGYYFRSQVSECLARNSGRNNRVPNVAILATAAKLELPSMAEGFDDLKYVRLGDSGFLIEDWKNEF